MDDHHFDYITKLKEKTTPEREGAMFVLGILLCNLSCTHP
jgi:hypothetical protein